MTFLNARAKNIGNDEGDVYTYFTSKLANLIQKNGGDHYFNWITLECTEQPAPHPVGTKTYLRLTSENFTITQMEKSFVTVLLEFYVKLSQSVDVTADTNKLIRLFVGLKNAAEFFGKLDSICNNVMLKNTQDDAVREQFAYNSIKGRSQKATAKFSHSTWENVSMMSESVCGIYVPLADIADGQPHKVQMELTIPYQDFLKYQAFTLYPNEIVGELKELVQTSMEGFVWAPISPKVVKENIEFLDNSTIAEDIPSNIPITRKFTQVGNPATIITEYKTGTQSDALEGYIKVPNGTENGNDLKTGAVTLTITAATVQMMRTNIAGFNIKPDCLAGLRSYLSHNAILIPSQTLDRRHFASAARATGIDATTDISLSNATNITIMFPKRATDATCFDNIMYQNVQLSVNKHSYPDTEVSTIGARFYQMQLVADELARFEQRVRHAFGIFLHREYKPRAFVYTVERGYAPLVALFAQRLFQFAFGRKIPDYFLFPGRNDDTDVGYAAVDHFVDYVLQYGRIHDGQHFLRQRFRRGKKARALSAAKNYSFPYHSFPLIT